MARRTVKLDDVAKAAGVSRGTASNVFSKPGIVREELRAKVQAAALQLGYTGPDPRGRMLRGGKINAIGVAGAWPLSYFFEDPYARVVMEGIGDICHQKGAGISLISALDERQVAWSIQSALVDGFILFCMARGGSLVGLARERNLPFVALDSSGFDPEAPGFWIDDVAGARMSVTHMLELGHKNFGILALPADDEPVGVVSAARLLASPYSGTHDRLRGYFETLAATGIDTQAVPIYETDNDTATSEDGMAFLMSRQPRPSAILAMSDRMALAALDWLRARGISVPEEVSIIGFDDVPEAARSDPPLTTVAQPMLEMGRRAALMVLDPGQHAPGRIALPIELRRRATTAPPRRQR